MTLAILCMNQSTSIQPEIIDLTGPEYDVSSKASNSIMVEQEKKRSRRRKRKRNDGDSTPSLVSTRDTSPVEGKIGLKMTDTAQNDPDVLLDEAAHRKERHSNEKRERQIVSSSSTSSRLNDTEQGDLFYIDLEPVPFSAAPQVSLTSTAALEKTTELLLPAHVSVFGEEPTELMVSEDAISNEEFIEYLDFDDNSKVRVFCCRSYQTLM